VSVPPIGVAPVLVAIVAATVAVVGFFGIRAGLPLGYLLIAGACWAAANYALEIVEHTALGAADSPALSLETLTAAKRQNGSLLALAAVLALLGARAAGPSALGAAAALIVVAGPAVAALLAVTGRWRRALRPDLVLAAAVGLGRYYPLLVIGSFAAAYLAAAAMRGNWLWLAAAFFAFFALAYGTGAAVYSRRLALGVHAPRSPESRAAAEDARRAALRAHALDHAYGIAARGRLEGALRYVEEHVRAAPDSLEEGVACYFAMSRWDDVRPALAYGRGLIGALEAAGRPREAAKLRSSCGFLETRLDALEDTKRE
jgi:hypothetical protein